MDNETLRNIFLSASIPLKERDKKYYESCDIIAIRDSVIALTTIVLFHYKLMWGGHPSITALIAYVANKMSIPQTHVVLYQSKYFKNEFPQENQIFSNCTILTSDKGNKNESILELRNNMLSPEKKFIAGIFIGGMEGVEEEYAIFKKNHPNAICLPIATTGAAAKIIYENEKDHDKRLNFDYAYSSLFQDLLIDKIK